MANVKHAVVRLDIMSGTVDGSQIKSVNFYVDDEKSVIDNAQIVELIEKDGRETYKATAPTATAVRERLALTCGVEMFYDSSVTHYLDEFQNDTAAEPARAMMLHTGNIFSATAEAFEGVPAVGKYVGWAQDSTKLQVEEAAGDKTFGKIVEVEVAGRHTFYCVDIL